VQRGNFPISVMGVDNAGCVGVTAYTLAISCQAIAVTPPGVSTGTVGVPFTQSFTQTGAIGGATFAAAGTLPIGITLLPGGTLAGTPQQAGSFPIAVTVTDANGCTGGALYTLTVEDGTNVAISIPALG
jgi:hypothetical protein